MNVHPRPANLQSEIFILQFLLRLAKLTIVNFLHALDVLGADALRYFLLREVVFGQDGSFSFDALVQRYNSDLANGLGNLASRTLAMITRYFKGEVPYPSGAAARRPADASVR